MSALSVRKPFDRGWVKIGAMIVRHGLSITFRMAEVMVPRGLFQQVLASITALRLLPPARC